MQCSLFGHLESAAFYHPAVLITKLVDIKPTVEFRKVDRHALGHVVLFKHFSTQNGVKNLDRIPGLVRFLEIEIDYRSSGVWIKTNYCRLRTNTCGLSCLRRSGECREYNKYY